MTWSGTHDTDVSQKIAGDWHFDARNDAQFCLVDFFLDRYPNHSASKRIDSSEAYKKDIEKLRSNDGDYHHGFNCGVLAAARMFADQADILHVNELVCVRK